MIIIIDHDVLMFATTDGMQIFIIATIQTHYMPAQLLTKKRPVNKELSTFLTVLLYSEYINTVWSCTKKAETFYRS